MTQLDLKVFGSPRVMWGSDRIEFRTRKALALLIYLTVEGGRHSRDKLGELLWRRNGRAMLRSALSRLRKALGDRADRILRSDRKRVGVAPEADIRLDLDAVRAALEAVREIRPGREDLEPLRRGVRAYQGPFLDAFLVQQAPQFEQWVQTQREAWRQRSDLVFDALTRELLERGRLVEAGRILTDWTELDPLNEIALRRTIKLHYVRGNPNAALRAYDHYQSRLAEELDLEPERRTQELVARVRQGDPALTVDRPQTSPRPSAKLGRPTALPLVGREQTWRALLGTYRSLPRQGGRVVILRGEAGVGKSRIGEEFTRWAEADGASCLRARGYAAGLGPAYGLIAQALRPEVLTRPELDSELGGAWLIELARLFPELRARNSDLPRAAEVGPEAQTRLFEAVARSGRLLAVRQPVVIWLDDLQWADQASLSVLAYALERWQREPAALMIMGACRDPGRDDHRVTEFIDRNEWPSLPIHRLERDEVKELMQAVCGEAGAPGSPRGDEGERQSSQWDELAHWLYRESEGHPLYLDSLIDELENRDLLRWRDAAGSWQLELTEHASAEAFAQLAGVLPADIEEMFAGRIERLSGPARDALVGLAVLGRNGDPDTLSEVAGLVTTDLLPPLEELEARGLLRTGFERDVPTWRIAHHKIGEVAYRQIGPLRRRIFHERALAALQSRQAEPARLAYHAEVARLPRKAAGFELQAGREARAALAVRQAVEHFERGLELIQRAGESPADSDFTLLIDLKFEAARALELVGEYPRAVDLYQAIAEVGAGAERYGVVASARNREATLAAQASEHQRARDLLDQALRAARRAEDRRLLAETRWNRAQLAFYELRTQEVIRQGKAALEAARALGDPVLTARCHNILGYGYRNRGRVEPAAECARAAAETFHDQGQPGMEADSLGLLAQIQLLAANPRQAEETAQRGRELALNMGNLWGETHLGTTRALALLELGELGQASSVVVELSSGDYDGDQADRALPTLMVEALLQRALLHPNEALDLHRRALSRLKNGRAVLPPAALESALCGDHALCAEWDEAAEYAAAALSLSEPIWYLFSGMSLWLNVEALLRIGRYQRAQTMVSLLEEQARSSPRMRVPFLRASSIVAAAEEQFDQAIVRCRDALAFADERGLVLEAWRAKRALIPLYQRTGAHDAADVLEQATARELESMLDGLAHERRGTGDLQPAS